MIDTESLEQIETHVARVAGPAFAVDIHGRAQTVDLIESRPTIGLRSSGRASTGPLVVYVQ